MKVKTSDLTYRGLDWAATLIAYDNGAIYEDGHVYIKTLDGHRGRRSSPSTDWAQGGPIIERERINLLNWTCGWDASMTSGLRAARRVNGPTALIAAMRCFCSAKLGDEIDIPEELCQQQKS